MERIQELVELYKQGRLEKALEKGEALARQSADSSFIQNLLGAINIGLGRQEQAASSFSNAVRIQPDYAEAHNNLGNVLKNLGRLDEAVTSYKRALEIKPGYAEAHRNLSAAKKYDEIDTQARQMLQLIKRPGLSRTILKMLQSSTRCTLI